MLDRGIYDAASAQFCDGNSVHPPLQAKRFKKAQCPIVERLTNSMMMFGRNNGKKVQTLRCRVTLVLQHDLLSCSLWNVLCATIYSATRKVCLFCAVPQSCCLS